MSYSERLERLRKEAARAPEAAAASASSETSGLVDRLLAETLGVGVGELRRDARFADLGLTSLLGVRFLDKVNRALDLRLGVETLFESSSPAEFAAFVTQTAGARPAKAAAEDRSPVARFYDFVSRQPGPEFEEVYFTCAPFPEIVPGFSWTRTFQDPARHREHFEMMRTRQREMREVVFAGIDFARTGRVLDFGCGLATDLIELAKRHPGLSGVGYTISPVQAEAGRARVAARGLAERVEIHCRDSARDPFPGIFDLAFGFEVAHHIADKAGLLGNLAAHLDEDGRLVLADCVTNTVAPIDLPALGSYTSTKDDYARQLAAAGFAIVDCVEVSREMGNFLHDPGLVAFLAEEEAAARAQGTLGEFRLMADVQRSWDAFGEALRTRLIDYLLVTAVRDADTARAEARNRRQLGGA